MVSTGQGALVNYKPVIAILGPTASGKSDLAQNVALALNGEVVSADSMQVYRGMDIGTAKVVISEQKVAHHLIDILDPGEPYSAQLFQQMARDCFKSLQEKEKVPVLCGGTGLYVQAALEDMRFPKGDQEHNPVREKYEAMAKEQGNQALWDLLYKLDRASAEVLHVNNVRRVVRALEMYEQGISYAEQVKNIRDLPEVVPSLRFGLHRDPKLLADRINTRVDAMIESGLINEVSALLNSGFRSALTSPQAIGYKEIVSYLDGTINLDEAINQIKTATRRYAKRQRTWLRRDSKLTLLDADTLTLEQMVSCIVESYTNLYVS